MLWNLAFLPLHVPSFSAVGYALRRPLWSPEEPTLQGRTWVVTGASGGLGRALALRAARAGASVLGVARNAERLGALEAAARSAQGSVRILCLDLSTLRGVRALLRALEGSPVDVLVNNVGVLVHERRETVEGFEVGFATNVLGPWYLTEALLAGRGLRSGGAVVTMSSGGMYAAALDVSRLQEVAPDRGALAYANHKRAQVLLTSAWRARHGDRYDVYVTHPGWADTPGVASSLPAFRRAVEPFLRDAEAGADTAFWLGARRPRQARREAIWFDRVPRPVHAFPHTARGDSLAALEHYLSRQIDAAGVPPPDREVPGTAPGAVRSAATGRS